MPSTPFIAITGAGSGLGRGAALGLARKGARVLGPNGKPFTAEGIGMALGMRELSRHLREMTPGGQTHHAGFSKQDRSRFLGELENCIQALKRAG